MGMYTEIIFGAELKKEAPESIINTIQYLVDGKDVSELENAPDHDFFRSERTWLIRSGGSYYFPGTVEPKFWHDDISQSWFLHFRTNIKNYDSEIEKFIDWIKPYIGDGVGGRRFFAIVTYEEQDEPTIYYLD